MLSAGVWFWQLQGRSPSVVGTARGPVWQFTVGADNGRGGVVNTSWGSTPDLDGDADSQEFVFLSAILHEFVEELFPGMEVKGSYQFRVTRNSELIVDEEEVENLAHALRDELKGRGFARAVRLEVADTCPKSVLKHLVANFELTPDDVFRCHGPVNLNRVIAVYDMVQRPDLKFPPFVPRVPVQVSEFTSVFDAVRKADVLMHHPYDSFQTVLDLVRQGHFSVGDPTLFHPLIDALLDHDPYMVLADYRAYVDCQAVVEECWRDRDRWTAMAIRNVARMGRFSSDRTIREYASEIWKTEPVRVE